MLCEHGVQREEPQSAWEDGAEMAGSQTAGLGMDR